MIFGDDSPLRYVASEVSARGPARWRVVVSAVQSGHRFEYTHFLVRLTAAGFGVCQQG